MHRTSWLTSLALAVCFASSAQAGTKFNLQASADRPVNNDTMTVVLSTENTSKDTQALYAQTNDALAAITARVKDKVGIKLKTASRRMQPLYKDDISGEQKLVGWMEQADVQLESKAFPELYSLVEKVLKEQKSAVRVASINYSLSDEAAQAVGDELYATALQNINHRAKVVATGLGKPEVNIDELSFNGPFTSGGSPIVMMRAKVAAMSAPGGMDSGESKVRVDLSGVFTASEEGDL